MAGFTPQQKLPILQHVPPQNWVPLLQVDSLFTPGCIETDPFDISGCNSIRGMGHTDAARSAIQFIQEPFGGTILDQNDVKSYLLGINSEPQTDAVKIQYMVDHPFIRFALNPTVAAMMRVILFGVPIDFTMNAEGEYY